SCLPTGLLLMPEWRDDRSRMNREIHVRLREGLRVKFPWATRPPNRGFGVNHIWAEHEKELARLGYETINDVARFVRDIIQPGAPIYCEFNHPGGKHRTTVLKSALGIVILEPREAPETDSGWIYVVVTAYSKRNPHGVQIGRIE
ncbi:hypothetical protein, partial [Salmonella enterica]|uniref:hypothetical protein n=1 Tax=Salmonella enterica TaxID=28901 RepID=UPI001E325FF1